jgi:hypothetical protein
MRGGDIPVNPPYPQIDMQNDENDDNDENNNDYIAPPTDDELNDAFEQLRPLGVDDGITEIALTHYPITIDELINIYLHVAQQPPYNRNWQNYDDARNADDIFNVNGKNFRKRNIANDILHLIEENIPMRPEMIQQLEGYDEGEGAGEPGMEIEVGKNKRKKRKTKKRKTKKRKSHKHNIIKIKKTNRRKTRNRIRR